MTEQKHSYRITILERQIKELKFEIKCLNDKIKPVEVLNIEPIHRIINIVCDYYNLSPLKFQYVKKREYVKARRIVAYFCCKLLDFEHKVLTKEIGNRNKDYISYAKNHTEFQRSIYDDLNNELNKIEELI